MIKLAIVILNWNGRKMLEQFLPSVIKYSSEEAQIIVADNASTDDSLSFLSQTFPQVRTIVLDRNYGFAGGYNEALKQVDAEYYLLLNSDVEVSNGWLTPLLSFMDHTPDCAACQPKLLSYDDKSSFEYAGASGGFIDRYGYPYCRGRIFTNVEQDEGQYDDITEIFWATGACMMIRRADFWEAGAFDSRFFAHNEEIDLCWRLCLMGRKIYCVPTSHVFHVGGGTLPKGNSRKTFLNFRNNLTMLYKNVNEEEMAHVMTVRCILDYVAAIKCLLVDRNYPEFKAIVQGRKAFLDWRSEFKVSRKMIQSKRVNRSVTFHNNVFLLWQYYFKGRKKYTDLNFKHSK
ncbi:MAG: glycosyltransferase family 2 protein [Prevotella sp.]